MLSETNLSKLHGIIGVGNVIDIILMLVPELHILRVACEQVVLGESVEFLLVGNAVDSLNRRSAGRWCIVAHVGELLDNIVIIILVLVFALHIDHVGELLNDVVAVVLVIKSVLKPFLVFHDVLSVFSVVFFKLNESWLPALVRFFMMVFLTHTMFLLGVVAFVILMEPASIVTFW